MIIEIKDKWALLVKDDTLRQNSKRTYEARFVFDDSWDGFAKTAIFEAGPASVVVVLTNDQCDIPAECLKHGSIRLKIGIYGVKGGERRSTVWCETSMIVPDNTLGLNSWGGGSSTMPDDVYSEIMAAIGDLSAAGFEGKTLAEVFAEVKNSVCGTATDEEVDKVLDDAFGQQYEIPDHPGGEGPDNTATDKEVDDILNEVFGEQP